MFSLIRKLITKKAEEVYICHQKNIFRNVKIVGLVRLRNESLILMDSLEHMSTFCDCIVAYDDNSTDDSFKILKSHPKVGVIIRNNFWVQGDREVFETSQRKMLLDIAKKNLNTEWFVYLDADERLIGDVRNKILDSKLDAIKMILFDAYATEDDKKDYEPGKPLLNFRGYFGIERRDIIIAWRNNENIKFLGLDAREPCLPSEFNIDSVLYCQHYGKAISALRWEQKCDYYIKNFDYFNYGKKWQERKGKYIHIVSDFGTKLFKWDNELFQNAIKIN